MDAVRALAIHTLLSVKGSLLASNNSETCTLVSNIEALYSTKAFAPYILRERKTMLVSK